MEENRREDHSHIIGAIVEGLMYLSSILGIASAPKYIVMYFIFFYLLLTIFGHNLVCAIVPVLPHSLLFVSNIVASFSLSVATTTQ